MQGQEKVLQGQEKRQENTGKSSGKDNTKSNSQKSRQDPLAVLAMATMMVLEGWFLPSFVGRLSGALNTLPTYKFAKPYILLEPNKK